MKKRVKIALFLTAICLAVGCSQVKEKSVSNNGKESKEESKDEEDNRIENMVNEMSLEEKVAQMFIARCPDENAKELAEKYQLGGYILFARDFENRSKDEIVQNIESYQENMKVGMFIGTDEEGGIVNRVSSQSNLRQEPFKSPQELYRLGGFNLIVEDTIDKSEFLKSLGINLNFAPVADISVNPNDFIFQRSFGQDAKNTAEYIKTVVNVMKERDMGSMLKHFPGYGNNVDTHTGSAYDTRSMESFLENDFIPFEAGIKAGANSVLVSHNIVESMDANRPASLSPEVHRILRERLNFNGVIVTDDLDMEAAKSFADNGSVAILAVEAGNDLLCTSEFAEQIPAIVEAVRNGSIEESRVDESVIRILEMKTDLGIIK